MNEVLNKSRWERKSCNWINYAVDALLEFPVDGDGAWSDASERVNIETSDAVFMLCLEASRE